jgi:hypothetical protein
LKSRKLRVIKYTSKSTLRANRSGNEGVSPFRICTKHGNPLQHSTSINTFSSRDECFQITPKTSQIQRRQPNGGQYSDVVKLTETNSWEHKLSSQRGAVERNKTVLAENENLLNHSAADVINQSNLENDSPQSTVTQFKRIPKHSTLSRMEESGFLVENSDVNRVDVKIVEVDTTQNDEMINLLTSNATNDLRAQDEPKFIEKSDSKSFFNSSVKSKKENCIPSNLSEVKV